MRVGLNALDCHIERGGFSSSKNWESVLDLGCAHDFPAQSRIFSFCSNRGIKRYVGVNLMKKSDIELSDPWSSYMNSDFEDKLQKEEFDAAFSFQWNKDGLEYLREGERTFDIILMLNLLHLTKVKEIWRDWVIAARQRLSKNGAICIEVFNTSWQYGFPDAQQPFTEKELEFLQEMLPSGKWVSETQSGRTTLLFEAK